MKRNPFTRELKRITAKQTLRSLIFIILGILAAGMGLRGFLLPNNFLDGGAMGISLLANTLSGLNLSLLIVAVNLPFIWMGYRQVSLLFALKTLVAIAGLALVVAFVPYPTITTDKLLIAVFGGFFLGLGIGLAIRGGCVIDGTEVLALYISKRSMLSVGDVIFIVNVIIFSFAAALVDIETALYAMLTYLSASKTVDFLIQGIEEYTAVTIISEKSEDIRKYIIDEMGRGVTIFKGQRGFGKRGEVDSDIDIIYTVITRLEVPALKSEIDRLDRDAFIIQYGIRDTKGGMIKKRPLH